MNKILASILFALNVMPTDVGDLEFIGIQELWVAQLHYQPPRVLQGLGASRYAERKAAHSWLADLGCSWRRER